MPRKSRKSQVKRTTPSRRPVRYQVAVSLDGFIAGPNGEFDWIVGDPEIDFNEMFSRFDTLLVGRRTFDLMKSTGQASMPGMQLYVFSHTLKQQDHPEVSIATDPAPVVRKLRSKPGKDIWLFGGGALFRSLVESRLVDTVEVAVIPVLLGEGVPLMPGPEHRVKLHLTGHRLYTKTGTMLLEYAIKYGRGSRRKK
jgi:dihydrofolate reductase